MSCILYQEMRNAESDLKILADAFFNSLRITNCEYGGIGLDCKRPFGNSDVDRDILRMIGAKPAGAEGYYEEFSDEQRDYARSLYHTKLIPYLRKKWSEQK